MGSLFLKVKHGFAAEWFGLLKLGSEMENLPPFIGKVLGLLGERLSEVCSEFGCGPKHA